MRDLEDICDQIFATSGHDGVNMYLDLVDNRFSLGVNEIENEKAKEYRKILREKYKKINL